MLIICLHQWHTVGLSQSITTEVLNVELVHVIYVIKLSLWMDPLQDTAIIALAVAQFQTFGVIMGMVVIIMFIIQIVIVGIIFVVGIGNMVVSLFLVKPHHKLIIQQQAF